jgi:hypothetical protein
MPRFYFDHMDGDDLLQDDDGLELPSADSARDEAVTGLAGIVNDVLPRALGRELAIEVSDENRRPLFKVRVWSELQTLG